MTGTTRPARYSSLLDERGRAKVVDKLTGQAGCADPEKAALEERVRRLEELLAATKGSG